ncbi:uncharacterized protein LOC109932336 isoform X1 [Rhincodon typus]|uniref:uncharacterized protein LOC109932336 isoform X1 n=1 Tax=Rhincodon typus TaxID=259920 RepID=UPI0009A34DF4|nr:uncharacterized protein LOC109932336 isoform X1 [Rhincodon typus]
MDEVWMLSLCLTLFAFVVALLSMRKSDDTSASSAKGNEPKSPDPIPPSPQPAARYMELTLEDIEKSLERLGAVLGIESAGVKEPASRRQTPASDSDTYPSLSDREEQPYRRGGRGAVSQRWAEHDGAEAWSHPERQDKIKSSEQIDPRRHGGGEGKEILECPPAATATQDIMEQIEQAVQETLDHNKERSEFVRVRQAAPAPRFEILHRDDMLQNKNPHSSE